MAILFLSIVSVLLIAFCFAIYFLSEIYRQTEYKTRLRQEALTAATILFNNEEVSPDLFKLLARKQMTALNKEEIALFNNKNEIRVFGVVRGGHNNIGNERSPEFTSLCSGSFLRKELSD